MKKSTLFSLILLAVLSCESPKEENDAKVSQISGLYIFIYSQPQLDYQVLGTVNGDYLGEMKDATSKEKNFGKRLLGALSTTVENIDFSSKLENMIQIAKESYPDANGIIFEGKMDQASVIRFK